MDSTPTPPPQAEAESGPSQLSRSETPPPPHPESQPESQPEPQPRSPSAPSPTPQRDEAQQHPGQPHSQPQSPTSPLPPPQLDDAQQHPAEPHPSAQSPACSLAPAHAQGPPVQPHSLPQSPLSSLDLSRPSPSIFQPPTPQPEEPAEDYFHRATPPAPQRSRFSAFPFNRLPRSASSENRLHARPEPSRQPSIRIRLSNHSLDRAHPATPEPEHADGSHHRGGRSRSASQSSVASAPTDASGAAWSASRPVIPPDPAGPARNPRRMIQTSLPRLTEEGSRPTMAELGLAPASRPHRPSMTPSDGAADEDAEHEEKGSQETVPSPEKRTRLRRVSRFFWPGKGRRGSVGPASVMSAESRHEEEYHEELVDWLDIIDPEVQTLSTLTNVQNSLFVPDLGTWVNRRPTYILSQHDLPARRPATAEGRAAPAPEPERAEAAETDPPPDAAAPQQPPILRSATITSRLSDSHYTSLPHGRTLDGWTAAEKQELDDRVRHMLHSRRSKFKRTMKGFGQYVRRPLGFFVTLYAVLITLFGLIWVIFLIGWVQVGANQKYVIHVIDSVLVALFAIMGDGLAPFRVVDTYHLIFVLRYSRMLKNAGKPPRSRLRKRCGLPSAEREVKDDAAVTGHSPAAAEASQQTNQAADADDMGITGEQATAADGGDGHEARDVDVEQGKPEDEVPGYHPLNAKQVKSLLHHQQKLAKSHSFYKPQATHTHFSFPLNYLVAVVVLLDCHSCLQISLGACTWGISYLVRPFALTTVILCASITCNLSAGLVITIGDRKTRKKDVVELLDRQELTGDAIARMEHKKEKREELRREAILERMAAA